MGNQACVSSVKRNALHQISLDVFLCISPSGFQWYSISPSVSPSLILTLSLPLVLWGLRCPSACFQAAFW